MALTKAQVREILSAAGVDSEHMADATDKIIIGHTDSINALRDEISTLKDEVGKYKADAEKLPEVQKAYDEIKATAKSDKDFDKLKAEFEQYKADVEAAKTKTAKTEAFKAILRDAGIDSKRIDTIVKVSADAIESVELDDDGKAKNAKDITKAVETEWADFKVVEGKQGAKTPNPPAKETKSFTRDDIRKMTPKEINDNWESIKESLHEN